MQSEGTTDRMSGTQITTLWTATSTDGLDQTTEVFTEMPSTKSDFEYTTEYNTATIPTTAASQSQTTSHYTEVSSEGPVTESTFRSTTMPAIISSVTPTPIAKVGPSRVFQSTSAPAGFTNGICEAPPNVSMLMLGTAVGSILGTCVVCAIIFLVWYKCYHTKSNAYRNDRDTEETNLGTRASADDSASPEDRESESRPPAPLPRSELQDARYFTMSDMRSASVSAASPGDIALRETVGNIR